MPSEIYVISGFLGAGKTTLIQKLLKEAFHKDKTVLIENDFGEISVDAALLKSGGVEVRELNSGCICCSLSGDFVKSLLEVLERYRPDKIIIEPSGVGKLSDVIRACADPRIQQAAAIKTKVTIVDVKRCGVYYENFGEFFENQIQNADVVLLSRTEKYPDKIVEACRLVKEIKNGAVVLSKAWDQLTADEILNPRLARSAYSASGSPVHDHHDHHEHREHHEHHEHHEGCGHQHAAAEIFDTVTIRTSRRFTAEELRSRIDALGRLPGTVLRAKGIISGLDGYIDLQYVPGDLKITKCDAPGDMLSMIGKNLNRQELARLFDGE
ncbi:GTPase, G3E family [Sporobacter termitidis DSM 10068]|uniref:GTPase, G3E family n=1 Tax=Sporobacter termitidis DSM 10068 TaxID=1123282 RepID=A0A1M5VGQ8_9FIRM|nr:CobW family GTP-binding protein [Sporobacter termitidis]SHH74410.1 GTPase, G3E family [Sporobacter termitidis DSM 10068]